MNASSSTTSLRYGSLCLALCLLPACATNADEREPIHFWPIFDLERRAEYESLEVMWPLYSHEVKGDDYFRVRQVPLFTWTRSDTRRELDILWPIFNIHSDSSTSGMRLAPFYFRHRSPQEAHDFVVPVFWWRQGRFFHVWPFYYWDANGNDHGALWPLIGHSERRTKVLPFFYHSEYEEETTWFIFPYGSQTSGDTESRWVVPFFGGQFTPRGFWYLVFPFWFQQANDETGANTQILFPVYWNIHNQDASTRVVIPIYGHHQSTDGDETYLIAPPLYVYEREQSPERTTHHALWPLFLHGSGPRYTRWRVFPFEYGRRDDPEDETTDSEALDYRSHLRVYPLYYSWKRSTADASRRHHVLFPVWWYKDDRIGERSHNVIFPFLWHYRSPTSATDVLFPFFWVNHDLEREEDYYAFFWPLAWYKSAPGKSDFRLLWKLLEVRHDDAQERKVTAVNPLFRHETVGEEESHFDVLGGLFGIHTREGRTSLRFLWFFGP